MEEDSKWRKGANLLYEREKFSFKGKWDFLLIFCPKSTDESKNPRAPSKIDYIWQFSE